MGMYFVKDWYCKPYKKTYQGIWVPKTWSGLTSFYVTDIWSDGTNIYHTNGSVTKVLNKSTSTWESKTWDGTYNPRGGSYIWTDADSNVYHSYYYKSSTLTFNEQYALNKQTLTWGYKSWGGYVSNISNNSWIWLDGEDTYYSNGGMQAKLDKNTLYFEKITWSGVSSPVASRIWNDGATAYYCNGSGVQWVLDKVNSTWVTKTWYGYNDIYANKTWTDGVNIYYSNGSNQYMLDRATSTWIAKTWQGLTSFSGDYIWKDGDHIYYSSGTTHYELT